MPASKYSINYIWSKASLHGLIPFRSRGITTAKTPELGHIMTDVCKRNVEIYIKYEKSCFGCIHTKSGNVWKTAVLPFIWMRAVYLCCRCGGHIGLSKKLQHPSSKRLNHTQLLPKRNLMSCTHSWWIIFVTWPPYLAVYPVIIVMKDKTVASVKTLKSCKILSVSFTNHFVVFWLLISP